MLVQICAFLLVFGICSQSCSGALIAYWNFNTYAGADTPPAFNADAGSGSLSFDTFTGASSDNQAGSTINARNSAVAGQALALVGNSHNDESFVISVSGTGLSSFVLTYAARRTSTGFSTHQWDYSTDGVTYTPFTSIGFTGNDVFESKTVDFSSVTALENSTTVYFRNTVAGATGGSGNNRFDNIAIEAVPEVRHYSILSLIALLIVIVLSHWRKRSLAASGCLNTGASDRT